MSRDLLEKPITISNIIRNPYYEDQYFFENDQLTLKKQSYGLSGTEWLWKNNISSNAQRITHQSRSLFFCK